jgi:hypothetical protein
MGPEENASKLAQIAYSVLGIVGLGGGGFLRKAAGMTAKAAGWVASKVRSIRSSIGRELGLSGGRNLLTPKGSGTVVDIVGGQQVHLAFKAAVVAGTSSAVQILRPRARTLDSVPTSEGLRHTKPTTTQSREQVNGWMR